MILHKTQFHLRHPSTSLSADRQAQDRTKYIYINPNSTCATSLIISFSQGGSKVSSIFAERIPSISLNCHIKY